MRPSRADHRCDWTIGPAGWAPILLLTVFALIGSLGAVTTKAISHDPGVIHSQIVDRRINVNTASQARLQLLPRIGPKMAERIVEERQANGPFEDTEDIQRVRGIGPKTAQRIADVADFSIER